ncbi:hypothetical protein AVEN_207027-1 [Araneus ventricosus]|uniref:Carboxylesterase type B domain-containing protein n=1 Tax=Araneus ventricosus TaxID=182803 RepID=A0A4Y2GNK9_ARAVE|nr:hypothetical protein AVEN_207027-1 [Araneus ventricosus]
MCYVFSCTFVNKPSFSIILRVGLFTPCTRRKILVTIYIEACGVRSHSSKIRRSCEAIAQYTCLVSSQIVPLQMLMDVWWQAIRAAGDLIITCPSLYYAEQIAAEDNTVHYYVFYYTTPSTDFWTWADWMKTGHFDELQYVFGILFLDLGSFVDQEDLALSRNIIGMWTDFVTNW